VLDHVPNPTELAVLLDRITVPFVPEKSTAIRSPGGPVSSRTTLPSIEADMLMMGMRPEC
jgi:hypothetical protein